MLATQIAASSTNKNASAIHSASPIDRPNGIATGDMATQIAKIPVPMTLVNQPGPTFAVPR